MGTMYICANTAATLREPTEEQIGFSRRRCTDTAAAPGFRNVEDDDDGDEGLTEQCLDTAHSEIKTLLYACALF